MRTDLVRFAVINGQFGDGIRCFFVRHCRSYFFAFVFFRKCFGGCVDLLFTCFTFPINEQANDDLEEIH